MVIDLTSLLHPGGSAESGGAHISAAQRAAHEALFRDLLNQRESSPPPRQPAAVAPAAPRADARPPASEPSRAAPVASAPPADPPAAPVGSRPTDTVTAPATGDTGAASPTANAGDTASKPTTAENSAQTPADGTNAEGKAAAATVEGEATDTAVLDEALAAEEIEEPVEPEPVAAEGQAPLDPALVLVGAALAEASPQEGGESAEPTDTDAAVEAATRVASAVGDARAERMARQRADRASQAATETADRFGKAAEAAADKRGEAARAEAKPDIDAKLLAATADADPDVDALIRLFGGRAGQAHAGAAAVSGDPLAGPGTVSASSTAAQSALQTANAAARTPPAAMEQVVLRIQRAVAEGVDRLRLQLRPASLGRLDIQIDIASDNRAQIVVSVEKPETYVLLQRDARALEQALRDAGLHLDSDSLSFNLQGEQAGHGEAGEGDERAGGGDDPSADGFAEAPEDEIARIAAMLAVPGTLDVRV